MVVLATIALTLLARASFFGILQKKDLPTSTWRITSASARLLREICAIEKRQNRRLNRKRATNSIFRPATFIVCVSWGLCDRKNTRRLKRCSKSRNTGVGEGKTPRANIRCATGPIQKLALSPNVKRAGSRRLYDRRGFKNVRRGVRRMQETVRSQGQSERRNDGYFFVRRK